jgi:hypothetical protein
VPAREDVLPDEVAARAVRLVPLVRLRNHLQAQCAMPLLAVHGDADTVGTVGSPDTLCSPLGFAYACVANAHQQNGVKMEPRIHSRFHTWTMALPPGFRAASMAVK